MTLLSTLIQEFGRTARRPWRVLNVFSERKRKSFTGYLSSAISVSKSWSESEDGLLKRKYNSYEEYLKHQRSGLEHIELTEYDVAFRNALRERLASMKILSQGASVLCLAARVGTEVKAFIDSGCFAVGIDINNRRENPYVLYGDFHHLIFADASVDCVYTNSLDHVFDIDKLTAEIRRVLKQGGTLILEVALGETRGSKAGIYEAFWWKDAACVRDLFQGHGFKVFHQESFTTPWNGECFCFRKE